MKTSSRIFKRIRPVYLCAFWGILLTILIVGIVLITGQSPSPDETRSSAPTQSATVTSASADSTVGIQAGETTALPPQTIRPPETPVVTEPPAPTTDPFIAPTQPSGGISAELAQKLDDILDKYGRTPLDIYNYVHDHYKYKYTREQSVEENALHLLKYGTGSCYNFASLTYLLFQRAGYDFYYVSGLGWQHGTYHVWVLANFDGGWYYVDSLYVRSAKMTTEQMEEKGYKWDKSAYPS